MSTWITIAVCAIIAAMLIQFWARGGTIPQGPAILTMVGIAGTFLGIALGLAHFDTADITGSIPRLIDGMKTAVWASFAGVLSAIILKYRDSLLANRLADEYDQDLLRAEGVGEDEPTSVVGELKLMRRDLSERINHVEQSLTVFSDRLAQQNANAPSAVRQDIGSVSTDTGEQHTVLDHNDVKKKHVEST